jgi:peptidyl-prolyl cis-trans isomerase SurA
MRIEQKIGHVCIDPPFAADLLRYGRGRAAPHHAMVLLAALSGFCLSQSATAQAGRCRDSAFAPAPDQVRLSEILIATPQPYDRIQVSEAEKKAREIREALRKGKKFDDLAKTNSQGPSAKQGGSLGYFARGKLAPAIEYLVFDMEVGEASEVLRTKQGFTILEVTDRIGQRKSAIEVLNTPITVDLKPYVQEVNTKVLGRWYALISDSARESMRKQANVAVQFVIHHDGVVEETKIASSPKISPRPGGTPETLRTPGLTPPSPPPPTPSSRPPAAPPATPPDAAPPSNN